MRNIGSCPDGCVVDGANNLLVECLIAERIGIVWVVVEFVETDVREWGIRRLAILHPEAVEDLFEIALLRYDDVSVGVSRDVEADELLHKAEIFHSEVRGKFRLYVADEMFIIPKNGHVIYKQREVHG